MMEKKNVNTQGNALPSRRDHPRPNLWRQSLSGWLQEVNAGRFDLVGAITRRAFNTIWLFLQQMPELDGLRAHFTSDNGLYAEAEKIAKFYARHGRFPRIAVLDDILIYGRNLDKFLGGFQDLVFDCLKNMDVTEEPSVIAENFYQNITPWIFVVNRASFSLKAEYQRRLRYQKICSESRLREYSDAITGFIRQADVANTSYVISAYLPEAPLPEAPSSWISFHQEASGDTDGQMFYYLPVAGKCRIYPTVRSYVKAGQRYFTPYLFMEDLTFSQVVRALQNLFDQISSSHPAKKLVAFFNRIGKYPKRIHVYCQLFYLVMSQVTLSVFLSECRIKIGKDSFDCKKIARNFSFSPDMEDWLASLASINWTREQFITMLDPLLERAVIAPRRFAAMSFSEREELQANIDYAIYEQALAHEQYGRMLRNNDTSGRKLTGEQSVSEFLSAWEKRDGNVARTAGVLSDLTMLIDRGDASLKARAKWIDDKTLMFYSSIRNTEQSLSILPRRIREHYDEFYQMAQFCWRDDDFPKLVESYFVASYNLSSSDRFVRDAVKFAELIGTYRDIVDSMLNWKSVLAENS